MSALVDGMNDAEARRILDIVGVSTERMDWVVAVCHLAAQRSSAGFIEVVTQVARVIAMGRLSYGDTVILSERRIFHLHELAVHFVFSEAVTIERLRAGQVNSEQFLAALAQAVSS